MNTIYRMETDGEKKEREDREEEKSRKWCRGRREAR